jgi:hypothetical protein
MRAKCSVTIRRKGGFLVAQALVVIPPELGSAYVRQPYEQLSTPKTDRSHEAIAWQFVVTKDGATPVAGAEVDSTQGAPRMAPFMSWSGSRWQEAGDAHCGGSGGSNGGWTSPTIEFISVCPSLRWDIQVPPSSYPMP